jgi:sec-independent protein translocase protein TatA
MPLPGPELIIILVIALLVLGPGKLPEVGSALGKSIREFRKATSDMSDSVKVDSSPLPPPAQASPLAPPAAPASVEPVIPPANAPAPTTEPTPESR